jgi:hypothetical protein
MMAENPAKRMTVEEGLQLFKDIDVASLGTPRSILKTGRNAGKGGKEGWARDG